MTLALLTIRNTSRSLVLAGLSTFAFGQSQSWRPVGPSTAFEFTTSPSYAADGLVWIATGSDYYNGDGGFVRSADHGESFAPAGALTGGAHETTALVASPTFASDATLFATSVEPLVVAGVKLWTSTDAGSSWSVVPQPAAQAWPNNFRTLAPSPAFASDELFLVAALGVGGKAFRSIDSGSSWSFVTPGFSNFVDIEYAPDYASSGLVYGVRNSSGGFRRSQNLGANFTDCLGYGGLPCPVVGFPHGIAVAPVGPFGQRVLFYFGEPDPSIGATDNLLRSLDNGQSWFPVGQGLAGLSVHELVVPPDFHQGGRTYAATDAGVYFSDDRGDTFQPLDATGLPTPVFGLELAGGTSGDLYALAGGAPTTTSPFQVGPAGSVYRLRLSGTGVVDLGESLPGSAGTPELDLTTAFGAPAAMTLTLDGAAPASPAFHVIGFAEANVPLGGGGVLVPSLDRLIKFSTGPSGSKVVPLTWPASIPAGFEFYWQVLVVDGSTSAGYSLSNALRITKL